MRGRIPIRPPSVDRVNADTSGVGYALGGAVLGGTAGDGWGRAAAYDAYADGLHTYALWYLRDHDAAADAVYCAFVAADRNHTNLQQPEQIQPWLYALLRRECRLRAAESDSPAPVSNRLRPKQDALGESGVGASLMQLEGNLRRAEFQSLAWPEAEGLTPAHREVLELTIRHGLDSRGLALALGLREGAAGLAPSRGFGLLADAWRELERSLAASAVAGSGRDNCAQLAELTFGWSGRLTAALRAPLTEHVDRCSRCQHYLHTVIGTPSAPTILPFVAAPRALRDIVLGELADFDAAAEAGVDLLALGARCGSFGPDGFPSRGEPTTVQGSTSAPAGAGRGPRRRTASGSGRSARPQRATPGAVARPQSVHGGGVGIGGGGLGGMSATGLASGGAAGKNLPTPTSALVPSPTPTPTTPTFTSTSAATPLPTATPPASPTSTQSPIPPVSHRHGVPAGPSQRPRSSDVDDVFRQSGSWADRVLPPQAVGAGAAATTVDPDGEPWRPEPQTTGSTGFVQTASGRFATRPPQGGGRRSSGPGRRGVAPEGDLGTSAAAGTTAVPGTSRLPHYGGPVRPAAAPSTPTSLPGASAASAASAAPPARPRHKARPMRQAVVSAMALGAIGGAAAAMAALLGAVPHPHASASSALDDQRDGGQALGAPAATGNPSADASGSGLAVSVTTGSQTGSLLAGATGLGLPGGGQSATSATPTTASSGAFYVSANQRAADPHSVQILLRNAGTTPLHWSAAPTVTWLALSQSSGTLAPGQSTQVTATATAAAPSGQWNAHIVFSPGGIVVTVHGGIPAVGGPSSPTPTATGTTPSSPPTSASPTPTDTSPTSSPTTPADPPTTQATPTPTGDTSTGSTSPGGTSTGGSQNPTSPSA